VPILKEDLRDDPGSRLWSVYANIAKTEDDELAENWDKDMDVLLIYVCTKSSAEPLRLVKL
jgi:hypothetical protein